MKRIRKTILSLLVFSMIINLLPFFGIAAEAAGNSNGGSRVPSVSYEVHIQSYGWQQAVRDGAVAGTSGQAKRLEAIKIQLNNTDISGGVIYRTHVQSYGWQDWVTNGDLSGTSGQAKRLEAIQIRLVGDIAEQYDILYRVHVQSYGWQSWTSNGAIAGTTGKGKRLEAIQIKLIRKIPDNEKTTTISYESHMQSYGWMNPVTNGNTSGVTGQAKRMEAMRIRLNSGISGGVSYQGHVQSYGWQNWVSDGEIMGTTGKGKRLEAVRIQLTGDVSAYYDIYYRVHVQTFGWLGWAMNGEEAGSAQLGRRIEAIQIRLVEKGGAAPGGSANRFINGVSQIPGEYVIKVNKKMNCVTVYKGGYPVKAMVCSAGEATPLGTFHIGNQYRWQLMIHDVYSQWASVITNMILFHSVPYSERDNHTLLTSSYNKLGQTASSGCVRLSCADAKWIYDNIDRGTTVIIYNSDDPGPLGKPEPIRIPKGQRWDPTDPNP